jgi:hypothetical protein
LNWLPEILGVEDPVGEEENEGIGAASTHVKVAIVKVKM